MKSFGFHVEVFHHLKRWISQPTVLVGFAEVGYVKIGSAETGFDEIDGITSGILLCLSQVIPFFDTPRAHL